jgi:hypothetical protein
MHRHHRIRRTGFALAAPLASLALLVAPALAGAGVTAAEAASCSSWTTGPPPSPGVVDNVLRGVTALSSCNVWVVGDYENSGTGPRLTLAEHWNGTSWTVLHPPSPGNFNLLHAVSAVSATNIWAVGVTDGKTLILHWNGKSWARVPSPGPGNGSELLGVVAVSTTSVWAVGDTVTSNSVHETLVLHWNGKKWMRIASPSPGDDARLGAVTAVSAGKVWAVGSSVSGTTAKTLTLRWNGKRWARIASPNPPGPVGEVDLQGVSATSAGNVWAVGTYNAASQATITMRWNGRAWKIVPSPSPLEPNLTGVSAVSASNAWAVGDYRVGSTFNTLILHWDGRAWGQIASPAPGTSSGLTGVSATSASNVWAAGFYQDGSARELDLAIHCC